MSLRQFFRLTLFLFQLFGIQITLCFHSITTPLCNTNSINYRKCFSSSPLLSTPSENDTAPTPPATFREAEILGLKLMQSGQTEEALKGK